ncbi:MAG: hypothetical protein ACLUJG_08475 [Lawsonibacter sp.]
MFAKSDIQPILNQGGRKEDVAASIFQAVVDQTVAGLTQGRELKGKIVFLGGPLHFLMGLRQRFVETLAPGRGARHLSRGRRLLRGHGRGSVRYRLSACAPSRSC